MRQILGIDVGGTKIAAGLVDQNHKISKVKVVPTSQADLLGQLIKLIESYQDFEAIGLAVPGRVLPNGIVKRLPNIQGFRQTNLKQLLEKRFKVRVNLVNDAKAFALAEALVGAGKHKETVVGVVMGTGIGVGFVRNGKIYSGLNNLAGEIGHVLMQDNVTLEQKMQKFGSFKVAKEAAPFVRILLSMIIRSVDPDIIVFGGARSGLPGMQKVLQNCLKSIYKDPLKTIVRVSKLKYAGIIGAVLALNQKS